MVDNNKGDFGEKSRTLHAIYTAAAKSLQSCPTLCDPIEGSPAHQAPPSLGSSRQEHWSGLPFPSPMRESEKWKWSHSVMSDSWRPHGLQPTRVLRPWDFPGKSTGVGCYRLLQPFTLHGLNFLRRDIVLIPLILLTFFGTV